MANVIHSNDFVKPISYTAYHSTTSGNEQAAWPASNVGVVNKPYQLWRSATALTQNSTRIVMDMGTTNSGVTAVVIDGTNFTKLRVREYTDTSNSGGTISAGEQTIALDPVDGRRKAWLTLNTPVAMRYLSVVFTDTTPSPAQYGYVGSIALLKTTTTMTSNPGFPLVYTSEQAVMANSSLAGGGRAPIRLGQRYATLAFSQSGHPWSSRTDLFTLAGYSSAEPVVVYLNNSDTSQVYICYRTTPLSISQPGPNVLALPNGVTFEECV